MNQWVRGSWTPTLVGVRGLLTPNSGGVWGSWPPNAGDDSGLTYHGRHMFRTGGAATPGLSKFASLQGHAERIGNLFVRANLHTTHGVACSLPTCKHSQNYVK